MTAHGAAADAAACVAINIQLLPGITEAALGELEAIYDQVFEMMNGEEMMAEMGESAMLAGKPTIRITDVDGTSCLQVLVQFTFDPFAQFGVDSRLLKKVHGRFQWAHTADEVIKGEGEQIDLWALQGMKFNLETLVDRKIMEFVAASEELKALLEDSGLDMSELSMGIAAALTFGSSDVRIKVRCIEELFNKEIRQSFEPYNEFLEEHEERRMMDADATTGMLTAKIVEMYCNMGAAIQTVYKDLKEKIAGPHSVKVMVPTGEVALTTVGLECLHKFFPTVEQIEAHEAFNQGGGDDDDDDW